MSILHIPAHTDPLPFYLCLAGPTASGKSQAALDLAQHFPLEIISVDSALVYRGMSIGTAKPSAEERARVPHHLIDITDPSHSYSAAQFVADTKRLVLEIQQRGALPLLVGGTMLYFKALQEGLDELPPSCPSVRADIQTEAQAIGWPALHRQLGTLDAPTAQRLAPQDSQRIGRALEVFRLTGRPLSSFLTGRNSTTPRPLAPLIALEPQNRTWLHQRIEQRLEKMWEQGWIEEVKQLYGRGDLNLGLPAMRCVGYRQIWQALDQIHSLEASGQACSDDLKNKLLGQAKAAALVATRQLAKRQLTWLRAMPHRHLIACDGQNIAGQLLNWVRKCINPA